MTFDELQLHVRECIADALENGYTAINEWTDERLAGDLQMYDDICSGESLEDVLFAVRSVRGVPAGET